MTLPRSLVEDLAALVGPEGLLTDPDRMVAYECDGFPIARGLAEAVVLPTDTEQVIAVVRRLARDGVPIIPRGSGTGLTGGCVGFGCGVIVCTSRMKRILEVDLANRCARVEAGVLNKQLTDHVQQMPGGQRLHFAPDPSSLSASTIAGNVATNAGGIHTLKYGVTVNHVLGMEVVLPDGRCIATRLNGCTEGLGADLPALWCGSEGTLGIITTVQVRLTVQPAAFRTAVAIFSDTLQACRTVTDIIAAGLVPAAMELMDGAMVRIVEQAFHFGLPAEAQALLLIELDGLEAVLDEQMGQVLAIARRHQARQVLQSDQPDRRAELWSMRKRAFGAIGRLSPSYCTQDACIPRSKLAEVLDGIMAIGRQYGMTITNVFHAGDGNVHPILLFDEHDPDQVRNTMQASHAILRYCLEVGGTITGEHGVGVEKLDMMPLMFDRPTLQAFHAVKRACDPTEQANPGKLLPSEKVQVNLMAPLTPNTPGGAMG